jgi:hypothetical protein
MRKRRDIFLLGRKMSVVEFHIEDLWGIVMVHLSDAGTK